MFESLDHQQYRILVEFLDLTFAERPRGQAGSESHIHFTSR